MAIEHIGVYPKPPRVGNPELHARYLSDLYASLIRNDAAMREGTRKDEKAERPWVYPEDYGAKGDGATDDTIAINAALTAACAAGLPLVFSAGTYLISPVSGVYGITLKMSCGIRVIGAGAGKTIIKVKNGGGEYFCLLGGTLTTTDLTNLEVCGITFDHNIANNGHDGVPSTTADAELSVGVFSGTNIRIHDCEIKNACSVQNIVVDNAACSDVWIERNIFRVIGDDPNNVGHDASIIYTHCRTNGRVSIKDNIFVAAGVNVHANRTAIETHDSNLVVSGNIIVNFNKGMNITGVNTTASSNIVVIGNNISGCKQGIVLYSTTFSTHTTGYGLDGVIIDGNVITVSIQDDYGAGVGGQNLQGIVFPYGATDLDAHNIRITNNIIRSAPDATGTAQSTDTMAIGWRCGTAGKGLINSVIAGNTIINFPMAGVKLWCDLENIEIVGNTFIDVGSSCEMPALSHVYRDPITIYPADVKGLRINNNNFYDNFTEAGTTRCPYFIYFYQNAGVTYANVELIDNTFITTGTAVTRQIFIDNVDVATGPRPYLRGVIYGFLPTSSAYQKYALGSRVYDPADGHLFTISTNQYSWLEDIDTIGTIYNTTLNTNAINLGAGANRTIFPGDDTHYVAYGGGSTLLHGASFQAFGGDAGADAGYAYIVSGTDEADRASRLEYGHRKTTGYSTVLTCSNAGVVNTVGSYQVDGTQVVSNRVVDADFGNTPNSGDADTDDLIDKIRDALITHGLVAAS